MKFHEIANIFPLMNEAELADLSEDIKANGQRESIITFNGKILDGRNRWLACERAGVKPRCEEFKNGSPAAAVISLNLKRRHLTVGQKTACAVEILPWLEKEAKERKVKAGKLTGRGNKKVCPKLDEPLPGRSDEAAGKLFGVSRAYVADTKAIKSKAPELFEKIKSGEKTISEVKREILRADVGSRIAAIPAGKFRVIYADPPWKYGSTFATSEDLSSLAAEANYPTMTIAQLCALPVLDSVAEDAVLFLWVTSPLLAECWPIIKAWGFEYKSSFVWDKGGGMPGNYNYVRHELLLIATRGSCVPDSKSRPPSIQQVKREGHSTKPEHFRKLINELYPNGPRLELFARKPAKGWQVWGNEV